MKKAILVLVSLIVLAACSSGTADSSDAFIESAIVRACAQLVTDYAIYRDRPDPQMYSETFADDGILVLPFGTFTGREALRKRMEEGVGKFTSRHMMSTTRIEVIDAKNATGISYAVIFSEPIPAGADATTPLPTDGPFAIGEYHDSFRLTGRGWKFSRREFKPVFQRARDEPEAE